MSNPNHSPLIRFVKRSLDVFRVLALIALIAWPLFTIAASLGHASHPDTWGVDISVYSSFDLDLSKTPFAAGDSAGKSTGVRDPKIHGKAELNIDTSSLSAFYIFGVITEIGGLVGFYILLQLRAVFGSLRGGTYFSEENSARVRKIGIVTVCWALISPLLQYFGGQAILNEYGLLMAGFEIGPAFEINGLAIFIGLAMIILSAVLDEANLIHETQQSTI